jgi:hypothetical protein
MNPDGCMSEFDSLTLAAVAAPGHRMSSIMPAFIDFPGDAAIIGRLLAGYTNLEIELMNCVQHVHATPSPN